MDRARVEVMLRNSSAKTNWPYLKILGFGSLCSPHRGPFFVASSLDEIALLRCPATVIRMVGAVANAVPGNLLGYYEYTIPHINPMA